MTALLSAGALLLLISGAAKLRHPASAARALLAAQITRSARLPAARAVVRLIGVVEIVTGFAVLVVGGRLAALALALVYAALAVFAGRLTAVAPAQDCGCFGAAQAAPVTGWHIATSAVFAVLGAGAATGVPRSLLSELSVSPLAGAPLAATVALLAFACYLLMTALPALLHAAREQVPG